MKLLMDGFAAVTEFPTTDNENTRDYLKCFHHESTKHFSRRFEENLIDFLFLSEKNMHVGATTCLYLTSSLAESIETLSCFKSALKSIKKNTFSTSKSTKICPNPKKEKKRKGKRSQFNWNFLGNLFILIHNLKCLHFFQPEWNIYFLYAQPKYEMLRWFHFDNSVKFIYENRERKSG